MELVVKKTKAHMRFAYKNSNGKNNNLFPEVLLNTDLII